VLGVFGGWGDKILYLITKRAIVISRVYLMGKMDMLR
jgi:hypothetical protein